MIVIRLDSPMMSFGGPAFSEVGNTLQFPPKKMLTGLMGAALGYGRTDGDKLQSLQEGFTYAVREDRQGEVIEDFQTVDLETPWMEGFWGDGRYHGGDEARNTDKAREILRKEYIADGIYTVALSVETVAEETLLSALKVPKWPVYIGRKACGAGHLRPKMVEARNAKEALRKADLHRSADPDGPYRTWIDGDEGRPVNGLRDWHSRIHAGKQWVREEVIEKDVILSDP
jgi:CRISPR system Cascade subunit CasD